MKDFELKKNGSGYNDPTAYQAIKNVEGTNDEPDIEEVARFRKMLHVIFSVCDMYDFRVESHITLKDKRTGRVWR